jgi:hypothetical protein
MEVEYSRGVKQSNMELGFRDRGSRFLSVHGEYSHQETLILSMLFVPANTATFMRSEG